MSILHPPSNLGAADKNASLDESTSLTKTTTDFQFFKSQRQDVIGQGLMVKDQDSGGFRRATPEEIRTPGQELFQARYTDKPVDGALVFSKGQVIDVGEENTQISLESTVMNNDITLGSFREIRVLKGNQLISAAQYGPAQFLLGFETLKNRDIEPTQLVSYNYDYSNRPRDGELKRNWIITEGAGAFRAAKEHPVDEPYTASDVLLSRAFDLLGTSLFQRKKGIVNDDAALRSWMQDLLLLREKALKREAIQKDEERRAK